MLRPWPGVPAQRLCLGFALLILISSGTVWAGRAKASEPTEAVIAIGDVHGDYDDFVAILQRTGLTDKQNHWIGSKTTFVQVGDLLDRGPKPREVLDLMLALEKEADAAGGRIVSLLGNHEVMNIMGDLRYVTPLNFASFADSDSPKRQQAAYEEYVKWTSSHSALLAELPQPMELTEAEWKARHPLGYVEQREAFSPKGQYGKWLRGHSALADVGGNVFLHGGIHPDLVKMKLDAVNNRVRDEIRAFDDVKQYLQDEKVILPFFNLQEITNVTQAEVIAERKSRIPASNERQARILELLKYGEWVSVKPDGPLWFRSYDQWTDEEGAAQVGKILDAYKANHIVVGHTVQRGGRIRARFNDRVFLIDTGMLSSYYPGGRASALEICGGVRFTAEYLDQAVVLVNPAAASSQGAAAAAGVTGSATAAPEKAGAISAGQICSATTAPPQ